MLWHEFCLVCEALKTAESQTSNNQSVHKDKYTHLDRSVGRVAVLVGMQCQQAGCHSWVGSVVQEEEGKHLRLVGGRLPHPVVGMASYWDLLDTSYQDPVDKLAWDLCIGKLFYQNVNYLVSCRHYQALNHRLDNCLRYKFTSNQKLLTWSDPQSN